MDTIAQIDSGALQGRTRVTIRSGLTEFPRALLKLSDSLEILDLSGNSLSSLPDWITEFPKLKILFLSQNKFLEYPAILGKCPSLSMVGFKSNTISHVPEASLSPNLHWLILTDNKISQLPDSISECTKLRKVMFAGNKLTKLPSGMSRCRDIELLRISANQLEDIPEWLFELPKLAWLALAGNPISSLRDSLPRAMPKCDWSTIQLGAALGSGASGVTYRAQLGVESKTPRQVAIKLFKASITSDGSAKNEIFASGVIDQHPNLLTAESEIENHPQGTLGMILPLIGEEFKILAHPPSLETCTRDVYEANGRVTADFASKVTARISEAVSHLHCAGVMHGDLYAHNILVSEAGDAILSDLGAASCFANPQSEFARRCYQIEARAMRHLEMELQFHSR